MYFFTGLNNDLEVSVFNIDSDKVSEELRIVYLSDLHSTDYGEEQEELISLVHDQNPDYILWGGDIVDDNYARLDPEKAYTAMRILAESYPSYYIAGNHEVWTNELDLVKTRVANTGVVVLSGDSVELNDEVVLSGLDDPYIEDLEYEAQIASLGTLDTGKYNILLAHRPERIEEYADFGFDLAFAGHAHGGQWIFPFGIGGFVAPNQGLFPRFYSGLYEYYDTSLIVSRGLALDNIIVPRLHNRPEIIVLNLY